MAELAIRLRGAVKRYGPITAVAGLDRDVPIGTCVVHRCRELVSQ
jgi:lipooligosaccharide transport system ATP-binding protein